MLILYHQYLVVTKRVES